MTCNCEMQNETAASLKPEDHDHGCPEHAILCQRCEVRPAHQMPNGEIKPWCGSCVVSAFARMSNPDCKKCDGDGEYKVHKAFSTGDPARWVWIDCGCSFWDGM